LNSGTLTYVALGLGLLALASFLLLPLSALLEVVFGAVAAASLFRNSKTAFAVSIAVTALGVASLDLVFEASTLGSPHYLALAAAVNLVALLATYSTCRVALVRGRLGVLRTLLMLVALSLSIALVHPSSVEKLGRLMESREPLEVLAYGGFMVFGASLPYAAAAALLLVYFLYDILSGVRVEEAAQAPQQLL
jgi:hypothetical protein